MVGWFVFSSYSNKRYTHSPRCRGKRYKIKHKNLGVNARIFFASSLTAIFRAIWLWSTGLGPTSLSSKWRRRPLVTLKGQPSCNLTNLSGSWWWQRAIGGQGTTRKPCIPIKWFIGDFPKMSSVRKVFSFQRLLAINFRLEYEDFRMHKCKWTSKFA